MKKIISLLLVLVMLLGILAGCAGKTTQEPAPAPAATEQTTEASVNTETTETDPKEITAELTLWDASWNEQRTPALIEKFNEIYPNIKVNVEFFPSNGMSDKYLTALTSGSSADLLSVNNEWISTYATAGTLMNLDENIAADNYDMSDFYDGARKGVTVNGSIYGMPYRAETHGMFYNVGEFPAAGYDTLPETWEEFLDAAVAITENSNGEVKGIAVPGGEWGNTSYQLINMILCSGGSILNEDNTECMLNSEKSLRAVQYFVDLYREYGVVPESIMENDNAAGRVLFAEGKAASFMSGAYDIDAVLGINPDVDLGTGMVPVFEGEQRNLIFAGWSTVISAKTQYPEAAWLLAKFLSSPEIDIEYSMTFSARASEMNSEVYTSNPLMTALAESVQYGEPLPVIPQLTQIRQIMFEKIQLALAGEMTAEEAMNEATAEINDIL